MAEDFAPPSRLMDFVSQDQLEEARQNRGARVDDGTAQRDRSLYEILKENKDKKDAEFNERFKHRPPKALDEDELEFLENIETSRKEHERKMAEDEEEQLHSFKAALASQSNIVHEIKEQPPPVPKAEDKETASKGSRRGRGPLLGLVVKVKPQAKKAKIEGGALDSHVAAVPEGGQQKSALSALLSYSSDDDN